MYQHINTSWMFRLMKGRSSAFCLVCLVNTDAPLRRLKDMIDIQMVGIKYRFLPTPIFPTVFHPSLAQAMQRRNLDTEVVRGTMPT